MYKKPACLILILSTILIMVHYQVSINKYALQNVITRKFPVFSLIKSNFSRRIANKNILWSNTRIDKNVEFSYNKRGVYATEGLPVPTVSVSSVLKGQNNRHATVSFEENRNLENSIRRFESVKSIPGSSEDVNRTVTDNSRVPNLSNHKIKTADTENQNVFDNTTDSLNMGVMYVAEKCKAIIFENINKPLNDDVIETLVKTCFRGEGKVEQLFDLKLLQEINEDSMCSRTILKFLPRPVPESLVALASFPGSGNTWTRVLLQTLTGIYTGSIYPDYMAHMPGSQRCPSKCGVFIVKTHKASEFVRRGGCPRGIKFKKAIFIMRNPYDAMIAEFNRIKGGKVGFAKQVAYSSSKWRQFVKVQSRRWQTMTLFWLKQYENPVHVLVYEDLKTNTMLEAYRLMKFLDVEITLHKLYCLMSKSHEGFYRAKKPEWLDKSKLFDNNLKDEVNSNIKTVLQGNISEVSKIIKGYTLPNSGL